MSETLSPSPVISISRYRRLYLVAGWILVLGGVLAMGFPFLASLAASLFIGWILVVAGLVEIVHACLARGAPAILLNLLAGLLSVGIGVFILSTPGLGVEALTFVLACFFAADGIIKILSAVQTKEFSGWSWIVLNGVSSLVLAGLILWLLPSASLYLLGIILGIDLLVAGATLLLIVRAARISGDLIPE